MRYLLFPTSLVLAFVVAGGIGSGANAATPSAGGASSAARPSFTIAQDSIRALGSMRSAARRLSRPLGRKSILPLSVRSQTVRLCAKPTQPGHAACFADVRTDSISSIFSDDVYGLTPNDLSSLYRYPAPSQQGGAGVGQTVAVVVVGDYSAAESDLAVYRAHFGLPPCTRSNGCLSKIGVPGSLKPATLTAGASSIAAFAASIAAFAAVPSSAGWAAETDVDTQMISATCPNCNILISEAATDDIMDLSNAAAAAIDVGATLVNASFGAPEASWEYPLKSLKAYNNYNNVKVVAAAGDFGYGVYFPASNPNVIAVGGTTLSVSGSTVSESVWPLTGSGCSTLFNRPAWQGMPISGCSGRIVSDISAVGDPVTGVAVYDSTLFGLWGGWAMFGGTSVATPIISGLYAISGDAQGSLPGAERMYSAYRWNILNVTSGSNGTCSITALCTARNGYSGPAGLGIPQGLGAF